jgi:hypothetical protein
MELLIGAINSLTERGPVAATVWHRPVNRLVASADDRLEAGRKGGRDIRSRVKIAEWL